MYNSYLFHCWTKEKPYLVFDIGKTTSGFLMIVLKFIYLNEFILLFAHIVTDNEQIRVPFLGFATTFPLLIGA